MFELETRETYLETHGGGWVPIGKSNPEESGMLWSSGPLVLGSALPSTGAAALRGEGAGWALTERVELSRDEPGER